MDSVVLAVILLIVGAVIVLVITDWFGGYISAANPIKTSGSAH